MALLARGPEVTVQLGCEGIPGLSKGHPEEATYLLYFVMFWDRVSLGSPGCP